MGIVVMGKPLSWPNSFKILEKYDQSGQLLYVAAFEAIKDTAGKQRQSRKEHGIPSFSYFQAAHTWVWKIREQIGLRLDDQNFQLSGFRLSIWQINITMLDR